MIVYNKNGGVGLHQIPFCNLTVIHRFVALSLNFVISYPQLLSIFPDLFSETILIIVENIACIQMLQENVES